MNQRNHGIEVKPKEINRVNERNKNCGEELHAGSSEQNKLE